MCKPVIPRYLEPDKTTNIVDKVRIIFFTLRRQYSFVDGSKLGDTTDDV